MLGLTTTEGRPESIARHMRLAYDPGSRVARRALENARGEDGVEPENAWPRGCEERFSWLRTDSACHATLHVSEWPRMRVGAAFLAPLLLQTRAERTVAVTMQVLGGARAAREVRSAQTAAYGDQRMRERLGFRTTVRDEREQAVAERVEEELADGHASVRFAGYVTVTAPNLLSPPNLLAGVPSLVMPVTVRPSVHAPSPAGHRGRRR